MNAWSQNIAKVKSGEASKVEFVDAVTYWLSTDIAESTEGMGEAISRRVVWLFPDDYALAVGANFSPAFYHLSKILPTDSRIPLPQSKSKNWTFSRQTNGWTDSSLPAGCPKPEDIVALVDVFSASHGEPKLLLPWAYHWAEGITDQEEEFYEDYADEGEENIRETMFELATAVVDETLSEASPWECAIGGEDEGLSFHSDFAKFQRFIDRVSDEKIAILDIDQHCAACSNGTYEDAVAGDPELEGKEVFRTWGQNSEWNWRGDGSVYMESGYIDNPEFEKKLKQVAEKEGLDMGLKDKDWQPTGNFSYES